MTLDAFCSNLRGVGQGGADLPRAWLAQLYAGIRANEIKLKGECKTCGDSAAIVPALTAEAIRRLRHRLRHMMLLVLAVVRLQRLAAHSRAGSEPEVPSSIGRGIVRRSLLSKMLARSPRATPAKRAGMAEPAVGTGGLTRGLFASPASVHASAHASALASARHSYDIAASPPPFESGARGASGTPEALRKLSGISTALASSMPSPRLSRSMTWHGPGSRPRASTLPDTLTADASSSSPNGSVTPRGTSRPTASVLAVGALIKRSSSWSRRPRRPKGARPGQRVSSAADEPPRVMVHAASQAPPPHSQAPAAASDALPPALPGLSLASLRPRSGTFGEVPVERKGPDPSV